VNKEFKEVLVKVKRHLRITKITCTRSIKGRGGDSYVGFSAAWDSIQDDTGGATDAQNPTLSDAEQASASSQGLSLKESRLAALVVGMQADLAAHDNAMAGGNLPQDQRDQAVRAIKHNYSQLMLDVWGTKNGETPAGE
jgi:hypothetical protein